MHLNFFECEHNGDLDNYKEDVIASGGDILNSGVDYEAELGWMKVQVKDDTEFSAKFMETDSYAFLT